ncbi:DUF3325 domain-containing protein [Sphingomonas sp. C3-2]|uniref:DUF3325 domain-containing protein n=1 Tax=Sphingomonas sp. C3-2 TaxID=3062169 RepID=UPI00294B78CD|nr:DUF3325 domain-containing protein [Sphingomonas sp. C3-2]WOK36803.1 DUF3325 domain-containing protein [Sphingomonas sp. C3-2]
MKPILIDSLTFLCATGGFAALMLTMARHQSDWFGRKLPEHRARAGRICGYGALVISLVVALAGHGWDYGLVAIFGWWTVAAGLVVAANCNRPRILAHIGGKGR